MKPKRIAVKVFASEAGVKASAFLPIFQRYIQQGALEGMLIDVADYQHVVAGPGMVLIGHECDYAFDYQGGEPGLLYVRKRQMPETLPEVLGLTVRLAVTAAHKLESEPVLKALSFDYSRIKISFLDRLNAPNNAETLAAVQGDIQSFFAEIYGDESLEIKSAHADPREVFALDIQTSQAVEAEALIERLQSISPVTS